MRDLINVLLKKIQWYTKTDMVYLAYSVFWLNLQYVSTSFLSFIFSVFLAQSLTKESLGVYQFILSVSGALVAFGMTGANTAIVRAVSRGYDRTLKTSIPLQIKYNLVIFCIGLTISLYYLTQDNALYSISFALIAITQPLILTYNTYTAYLTGKKLFKKSFIYSIFSSGAYYGSMICVVLITKNPYLLLTTYCVINVIINYTLYKKTEVLSLQNPSQIDSSSLVYAKRLSLSNIVPSLFLTFDNILVYTVLGPASLAIYTISSLIPERISGILRNINTSAAPKFAEQKTFLFFSQFYKKVGILILVGLLFISVYIVCAPLFFSIFYPDYKDYVYLSQLFAVVSILGVASSFVASAFINTQSIKSITRFNISYPLISSIFVTTGGLTYGIVGIICAKGLASIITISIGTWKIYTTNIAHK